MKRVQGKKTIATNVEAIRLAPTRAKEAPETADERVSRLYKTDGGALIAWLLDEARRRRMDLQTMAREVGVTYGYINHLRTGFREISQISHNFATAYAEFLGVPTVVVLVLSGYLSMSDFAVRSESEEDMLERAMRYMQDDPAVRSGIPVDLGQLGIEGKRAVALMYAQVSEKDIFQTHRLPQMVRWLQRAVLEHDENSFAAVAGHRDTSVRIPGEQGISEADLKCR